MTMIPTTHHGVWQGPNRLWLGEPAPERSEGGLSVAATTVDYTWSFRGAPHQGRLALFGPAPALRAEWRDSFHAAQGMALHGYFEQGVVHLFCTYPAGDGPEWGWRIEVDVRDPEHFALRMFNVEADGAVAPAVDLRGARP